MAKTGREPYHRHIEQLIDIGHADLKFLNEGIMINAENRDTSASCTVINFSEGGAAETPRPLSAQDLQPNVAAPNRRRVFILEGMSRELVEQLGSSLQIEPEFFASHIRATTWEHRDDRSGAKLLPSVRKDMHFWTLEYFDIARLNGVFPLGRAMLYDNAPTFRRIIMRNAARYAPVRHSFAVLARIVSFWKASRHNGGFDVVLVDRPIGAELKFQYRQGEARGQGIYTTTHSATWTPYGGGIIDFARLDKRAELLSGASQSPGIRDGSMRVELEWRLIRADLFTADGGSTLEQISSIVQKVVLSKWSLTVAFMQRDFWCMPLQKLNELKDEVRETLLDLDVSQNLLNRSMYLMRKNISQFGLLANGECDQYLAPETTSSEISVTRGDWVFLYHELRAWSEETKGIMGMRLTNNNVLDSRLAQEDSRRAQEDSQRAQVSADQGLLLTRLGQFLLLVYTPASFAYGVLSMGGDFSPGQDRFWVFFAIAIPASLATVLIITIWTSIANKTKS